MEENDKLISYHKDFEKDPEAALLFQKKGHYSRKSKSLPKPFMTFFTSSSSTTVTKLPDISVTPTNGKESPKLLASAYRAITNGTRKPTLTKTPATPTTSPPPKTHPQPLTPLTHVKSMTTTTVTKTKAKTTLPL